MPVYPIVLKDKDKSCVVLDGIKIETAYTLRTWFDQNCIEVVAGCEKYRISADEILKLLSLATFEIYPKRKHIYLKVKDIVDTRIVDMKE